MDISRDLAIFSAVSAFMVSGSLFVIEYKEFIDILDFSDKSLIDKFLSFRIFFIRIPTPILPPHIIYITIN